MSTFTFARALVAGAALLLVAGCSKGDDPTSAFPDETKTRVYLRPGIAKEKLRTTQYADDKVTPLSGEVTLFNDHVRLLHYEHNLLVASEEYYKAAPGQERGALFLSREYMPDGRNLKKELSNAPDGSLMTGLRNPDESYTRNYFDAQHHLVRLHIVAKNGDTIRDEIYASNSTLKQKTTRDGDVLIVDTFDDDGWPTLTESKDAQGYKQSKTLYYPRTRQIRMKAEKEYYQSKVTYYRADGSVEQKWDRSSQTLVIQHFDAAGNVVWRQNLLLYRMRMGAPSKLSDWRIFSVEEVNSTGGVKRRIMFDPESNAPNSVQFPTANSTDYNFEGVIKILRKDGTVETVKFHRQDNTEVTRETHSAAEHVREPINSAYAKMPTEDDSIAPMQQIGMFGH